MRASEWIQVGFAIVLALAAWIRPLSFQRRFTVALLAAFAALLVLLARMSALFLTPDQVSILRDWLPVALTLVPYWQTGQFFLGPDKKIQARLIETDRRLLAPFSRVAWPRGYYVRLTLEWAYMFCYPLVPLGLGVLYAAGLRSEAGVYWFFVLVPTYLCYAITPLVPALPPRTIGSERSPAAPNKSRVFNLWILKHGSIQAISFPSAHVASAVALSLVLLHYIPAAGIIFLAVSFWIAVAAIAGGYHYAIDVLLGAIMAWAVFEAWVVHLIPSALITAPAISLVIRP